MKQPFVAMRRSEIIGGIIWFILYATVFSLILEVGMELLGVEYDEVTLNAVFFVANFLITALVFWRFLADSLLLSGRGAGKLLKGALLGFCLYEVLQILSVIVIELIAPELITPNDDTIAAIAASNYRVMWVGAVLLAPLTEETLVRGLVFGNIRRWNRPAAYIVTALLFAFMHIAPYVPEMDGMSIVLNGLLYALPSVALCACYEYSGTIWAPILLHMALNAISMTAIGG